MSEAIPDARVSFILGKSIGQLPVTLLTVPAGLIYRIWDAVIQMQFESTASLAANSILDAWIEIQGGDVLAAVVGNTTDPSTHCDCGPVHLPQHGRALAPATVIRVTSTALPANCVARVTGGIVYSAS